MLRKFIFSALTLALIFASYKLWHVYTFNQLASNSRSESLAALPIQGTFSLTDHNGQAVTEASYKGRYTLVFFGYTYCPDVCPTVLMEVAEVMDSLGPQAERVVPIFITVDPERDTVEIMKDYVTNFHPAIVGLTGSTEETYAAAQSFRAYFGKVITNTSEEGEYLMSHSARLYLMGPDAKPRATFKHGTTPDEIAKKLKEVL